MKPSLEALVVAARAALESEGGMIAQVGSEAPRFELFGAANSICSQKVRAVLAHHGLAYRSHSLNLFGGQTYVPAYVRMRLRGCDELGDALVSRHSGSTSVIDGGGCDAVVVPTLVDWHEERVVVDSRRICNHLDTAVADASKRLRPESLATRIDAEIDIIDNLPNYQMLSGRPPGPDRRPEPLRGRTGVAFAMGKVERCDQYLNAYPDDADLQRAYAAKRAKELDAATHLFDDEAMRAAYDKAAAACDAFERRLAGATTRWLLGDQVTLADVFWGVELTRIKNLDADAFVRDGRWPAIEAFAGRTRELEAIRRAIVDWPGALF